MKTVTAVLRTVGALLLFPGIPAFLVALAIANLHKTDLLSWLITGAAAAGAGCLAAQLLAATKPAA